LLLAEDGTPLIASNSRFDSSVRRFRTLDGEQVESPEPVWPGHLPGPDALERDGAPLEWSTRIRGISDCGTAPTYWYLIHDGRPEGQAWLEGFDSDTRQCVGYIGRHGFRASPPTPDDLFPMEWRVFQASTHFRGAGWFAYVPSRDGNWRMGMGSLSPWIGHLVTDARLVEVDVRERRVRVLFEAPDLISATLVTCVSKDTSGPGSGFRSQFLAVRSADRLWIVDPHTNRSQELAIPALLTSSAMAIFIVDDQVLLTNDDWGSVRFVERPSRIRSVLVVWLSRDGRVLRERSLSLRSGGYPKPGVWALAATVPVPIAIAVNIFIGDPLNQQEQDAGATYVEALTASWGRWRGSLVAVSLLTIAAAVWCFWRHRRYAQPGAWAWCVFVLLLGVPGLIGYLLHRRWPVRETCAACGRRAVVDREACQHCGAAFPQPQPQGSEVFA